MSAIIDEALRAPAFPNGAVPPPNIIIPAHNEEASIGRCLSALLSGSHPGEFEIIVVCNGCSDGTANVARGFGSTVRVVELEVRAERNHRKR